MIYFDSAATSFQKPPEVAAAMQSALRTCASASRGGHRLALAANEVLYDCRALAGELFEAEPEQVVFTMNATHGLNIAIASLVPQGAEVVISAFEHNAVVRPLYARGARLLRAGSALFSPEEFLESFEEKLRRRPAAAVCTHVSNVFGYVLPIERVARLCRRYGVKLIVDASQSAGTLPVSLRQSGAAFIAMPGHKGLYGPQGTGLLLCADGAQPLLYGGSGSNSQLPTMPDFLPDRLEAGTQNVTSIAGLAAGMRFVRRVGRERIAQHERKLLHRFRQGMEKMQAIESYFGEGQSAVASFRVRGVDCEEAAQRLSDHGFALRAGLHCAPEAHRSVGTLETGTLRASFGYFNTTAEVRRFLTACEKLF